MFIFLIARPKRSFQQKLIQNSEGQFTVISNTNGTPTGDNDPIDSTFRCGLALDKIWKDLKDHQRDLKSRYCASPYHKNDTRNPSEAQYIQAMNELYTGATQGLQEFAAKADRLAAQLTPRNGPPDSKGWQRLSNPIVDRQSCERILGRLKALGSGEDVYTCRRKMPKGLRFKYRVAAYMHLLCVAAAVALLNDENFLDGDRRDGSDFETVGSWLLEARSKLQLRNALELFSVFCASRGYYGFCPFFMLQDVPFGADKQLMMLVEVLQRNLRDLTVLMEH